MTTRPCVSADDLAAFIDGALAPVERDRVIEHLADCTRCQAIYEDVVGLMGEDEEEEDEEAPAPSPAVAPFPSRPARPNWYRLAAGLAAVGLGVALWLVTQRVLNPTPERILARLDTPHLVGQLSPRVDGKDPASEVFSAVFSTERGEAEIGNRQLEKAFRTGAELVNAQRKERAGLEPDESAASLQQKILVYGDLRLVRRARLGQAVTLAYVACQTGNLEVLNDPGLRDVLGENSRTKAFSRHRSAPPTEEECETLGVVFDDLSGREDPSL